MSEGGGAPAGFWRRYAAWSLDWIVLGVPMALLLWPLLARAWTQFQGIRQLLDDWVAARFEASGGFPSLPEMATQVLADPALAGSVTAAVVHMLGSLALGALAVLAVSAVYFVWFEAGAWQATPGKRALRLRVRAADGGAVGFGRALARHLAGALSWLLLNLGHALAGWRRDHRALHDLIAGTQVVADAPMPAAGRAWLYLQLAALLLALFGVLAWLAWMLLQIAAL